MTIMPKIKNSYVVISLKNSVILSMVWINIPIRKLKCTWIGILMLSSAIALKNDLDINCCRKWKVVYKAKELIRSFSTSISFPIMLHRCLDINRIGMKISLQTKCWIKSVSITLVRFIFDLFKAFQPIRSISSLLQTAVIHFVFLYLLMIIAKERP